MKCLSTQKKTVASVQIKKSKSNFKHHVRRILKEIYSQFHQRYTRAFFVRIFQQSQNVTRKMTFVQNIRTYNVDEIDTYTTHLAKL